MSILALGLGVESQFPAILELQKVKEREAGCNVLTREVSVA